MTGGAVVTVQMSGRTAIALRYILPLVAEAVAPAAVSDNDGETMATLEQAVQDIDRALPAHLRGSIDNHKIAEHRMDVIDKQREAGVRPTQQEQGGGHGGEPK